MSDLVLNSWSKTASSSQQYRKVAGEDTWDLMSTTSGYVSYKYTISDIPSGADITGVSLASNITYSGGTGTNFFYIAGYSTQTGTSSTAQATIANKIKTFLDLFDDDNRPSTFSFHCQYTRNGPAKTGSASAGTTATLTSSRTFTVPAITITYTYSTSGTLNTYSITLPAAGTAMTVTLIPPAADTYYHTIDWYVNGAASSASTLYHQQHQLSTSATTDTYTVPQTWLNYTDEFGTKTVGQGHCKITTYTDSSYSSQYGDPVDITFTISMTAEQYTPTISSVSLTPVKYLSTSTTLSSFYSNYSCVRVNFTPTTTFGATGTYSITENSSSFATSTAFTSGSAVQYTNGASLTYNAKTYQIAIVDSRNQTATTTISLPLSSITDLAKPTIDSFVAKRCALDKTDDVVGAYLKIIYSSTINGVSEVGNSLSSINFYYYNTSTATYVNYGDTLSGTSSQTNGTLITVSGSASTFFVTSNSYDLKLMITDAFNYTSEIIYSLSKASCVMHMAVDGNGLAFGGFSTATSSAHKLESFFPAYFNEDVTIAAGKTINYTNQWTDLSESLTNCTCWSTTTDPVRICKNNGVVFLTGAVKNTAAIASGSSTTILTLSSEYYPPYRIQVQVTGLKSGSTGAVGILLVINTDGTVAIRNASGASYPINSFTQVHLNWAL